MYPASKKNLPFDKEQLETIAKRYPTPFHIYDEAELRRRARLINAAFSWNEGFREYYAVKACPNPSILRVFMEEGCGLDCSSYTELMLADGLNAPGSAIMFSSNATPAAEFEYARRLNAIINLDDITHIDFLAAHGGIPELVCCRYNPGGSTDHSNDIMDDPREAKYGFTSEQLFTGMARLKAMGVKHFGLHAFIVSNALDQGYYPYLARLLFTQAAELAAALDIDFAFVNLSGGIGIPYKPETPEVDVMRVGQDVKAAYEDVFIKLKTGLRPAIFTELGRYMSGPAGYLVTRAIHEKNIYKRFIGVDACAADLMRPAMYGAYHHITVMGKQDAPPCELVDVTGALCENNDKFAIDRELPHIDMGDLLVLHDTGAHGHSMGYNYNGKLRSAELLRSPDGSVRLIRRAETPMDYFATLDVDGQFYHNITKGTDEK